MKGFPGFPGGAVRFTAVPDLFWAELLPQIDDLAELKVTMHCIWRLYRKRGELRYLSHQELLQDDVLMEGLRMPGVPPQRVLEDALARAVTRGSLLRLDVMVEGEAERWYFVNTERARHLINQIREGALLPETMAQPAEPVPLPQERPNIFALYEQNVGLLQPIIAEELREAERDYPLDWLEDAFQVAAERNVRNWRYIRSILERWAQEGRDDGQPQRQSAARRPTSTRRRFLDELE
ncbi:MAG TPA: DnaD domain protein [Ardenticatenaceae bacterium]|jgi:DnaD/phage-associated family protein